jgi:hypothetical protein
MRGSGSAASIANGYGLDGPGIESRWGRDFSPDGPGAHAASCTMGTGSYSGVKSGRGLTLTPLPHLVPWSWKSRAMPLLPLCSVRPLQILSACTWVHFTLTLNLSDLTSNLLQQYVLPVPLRFRKTSYMVFVAFVRPMSEPAQRFFSCRTDFSQQMAQVLLFLFLYTFLF